MLHSLQPKARPLIRRLDDARHRAQVTLVSSPSSVASVLSVPSAARASPSITPSTRRRRVGKIVCPPSASSTVEDDEHGDHAFREAR